MIDDSRAVPPSAAPAAPARRRRAAVPLLDRERSILQFNRRVLAQARRADVPLLERLRYVTIVSSNLDEFFEVRVADSSSAARQPGSAASRATWRLWPRRRTQLIDEQYALFNDELMPALQREGIVVLNHAERDAGAAPVGGALLRAAGAAAAGAGEPGPVAPVSAGGQQVAELHRPLGGRDAFGRENSIAIVKVPRVLPRVIRLPDALCGGRRASCC
jgi:polyphosphate kinase